MSTENEKSTEEVKEAEEVNKPDAAVEAKPKNASKGKKKGLPRKKSNDSLDPEFEERVVAVNRVAKVVKGGRRFSFSALMIVGDKKGRVGYGLGKAKEVPEAIRKATEVAKKNLVKVPIEKGTFPHIITGLYDAGKILFKPAADGTGIKAAGACRSILELAGIKNVLTKSLRGNNPHNIVKATFDALTNLRSVDQVAAARGKESKGLRLK